MKFVAKRDFCKNKNGRTMMNEDRLRNNDDNNDDTDDEKEEQLLPIITGSSFPTKRQLFSKYNKITKKGQRKW